MSLQDRLLQEGKIISVHMSSQAPQAGTMRVARVAQGMVHLDYVPNAAPGGRSYRVAYPFSDCTWMISRGIWREIDQTRNPRMSEDEIDSMLSMLDGQGGMQLREIYMQFAQICDPAHVREVIHRRLDMVWDRADAHLAQSKMTAEEIATQRGSNE